MVFCFPHPNSHFINFSIVYISNQISRVASYSSKSWNFGTRYSWTASHGELETTDGLSISWNLTLGKTIFSQAFRTIASSGSLRLASCVAAKSTFLRSDSNTQWFLSSYREKIFFLSVPSKSTTSLSHWIHRRIFFSFCIICSSDSSFFLSKSTLEFSASLQLQDSQFAASFTCHLENQRGFTISLIFDICFLSESSILWRAFSILYTFSTFGMCFASKSPIAPALLLANMVP